MGMFCLTGSTKLSGPSTCKSHCHHWHCSQSCCWKCPPFHLRFLENAAVSINACGAPTLQCYHLLSRLWQQFHWTCKKVEATWTPVYAGAKPALKLKCFLFHHIAHVSLRKRWVVGVRLAGCIGVLCIWVSTDCTQIKTVFQKLSYCQSRVDLLDLYKAAAETTFSTPILPLAFVYVNKVEQWTKTSPRNNLSSCLHFSNLLLPIGYCPIQGCNFCFKFRSQMTRSNLICLQRHTECLFSQITCPFAAASSGAASKVEKVSCRVCRIVGSTVLQRKGYRDASGIERYRKNVLDFFQRRDCERHGQ